MSELNDPKILFAAERNLLAWNRTSLSLIAFGFIVDRTGLLMRAIASTEPDPTPFALTFWIGMTFLALGSFTSANSARRYLNILRVLDSAKFPKEFTKHWGAAVNYIVAALGVGLMVVLAIGS